MNYSESLAKSVIEAAIPGAQMRFREEQANSEFDFWLAFSDGSNASLEVTRALDQTSMETMAAIGSKKSGGPTIKATECKKSWAVSPANGVDIRKIRKCADHYLAKLEHEGIERFDGFSPNSLMQSISRDLGLTFGRVFAASGTPRIIIGYPITGGAVGATSATEAGEKEAWKPDNRKKLGAGDAAERHLVVHVAPSLAWTAIMEFDPPAVCANLPSEITHLWLIACTETSDRFAVWQASTVQPWSSRFVTAKVPKS